MRRATADKVHYRLEKSLSRNSREVRVKVTGQNPIERIQGMVDAGRRQALERQKHEQDREEQERRRLRARTEFEKQSVAKAEELIRAFAARAKAVGLPHDDNHSIASHYWILLRATSRRFRSFHDKGAPEIRQLELRVYEDGSYSVFSGTVPCMK